MTKIYDAEGATEENKEDGSTNPHPIARSQNLEIGPSPPYLIQVKINWRNLYGWIGIVGYWVCRCVFVCVCTSLVWSCV